MSLWESCVNTAANVCYVVRPQAKQPFQLLALAVILQALLDDYYREGFRISDDVYRAYAEMVNIDVDYITLFQTFIKNPCGRLINKIIDG